jgi:hypothetical protein
MRHPRAKVGKMGEGVVKWILRQTPLLEAANLTLHGHSGPNMVDNTTHQTDGGNR